MGNPCNNALSLLFKFLLASSAKVMSRIQKSLGVQNGTGIIYACSLVKNGGRTLTGDGKWCHSPAWYVQYTPTQTQLLLMSLNRINDITN